MTKKPVPTDRPEDAEAQNRRRGRAPLRDVLAPRPARKSKTVFEGHVWDVMRESFRLDPADKKTEPLTREIIEHPGAVAVMALRTRLTTAGPQEQVALVRQYRHPVGMELWEIPAGLRDVDGESLCEVAQRELWEEADLRAGQWHTLVDFFTTPGGSSEAIRVFLARQVSDVPEAERFTRTDEEAAMPLAWVGVEELIDAVLDGRVHNPSTVAAVLALHAHRAKKWSRLRPADAPFVPHRTGNDGR
ncbi:ADP-ribose pyrophosphatase [Micrococcus cohnii]|uniref:ADP-ribose pyrophosphatase n=1 Tax=Micrococcus cohnii TaxID=993416 RepID=A0A7W7GNQ1_9MICC|nr:NUDIX hydrolase [Micrococcus cohnii]MBB4735474.1 ADP-ribose pyrophosphatase [Micrococcus cohnii]